MKSCLKKIKRNIGVRAKRMAEIRTMPKIYKEGIYKIK